MEALLLGVSSFLALWLLSILFFCRVFHKMPAKILVRFFLFFVLFQIALYVIPVYFLSFSAKSMVIWPWVVINLCACMGIFYLFSKRYRDFANPENDKGLAEEMARRQSAEYELKQKNERLIEAERTARLGHAVWDVIRDKIYMSEVAYEILGLKQGAELTYGRIMEPVHPADVLFIEESIRKSLKSGQFRELYFRIVTATMQIRHLLLKGKVVKNKKGQAVMVTGTIQDVSETRKYIYRIEHQNEQLKKIAWVQSHRMRSPIATMKGLIDLLNVENTADPVNKTIIKNIYELSDTLDTMIHELDQLTRESKDV